MWNKIVGCSWGLVGLLLCILFREYVIGVMLVGFGFAVNLLCEILDKLDGAKYIVYNDKTEEIKQIRKETTNVSNDQYEGN